MGSSGFTLGFFLLPSGSQHWKAETEASKEPSRGCWAFAHAALLDDKQGSPLATGCS